jgi:hypothetical protein
MTYRKKEKKREYLYLPIWLPFEIDISDSLFISFHDNNTSDFEIQYSIR